MRIKEYTLWIVDQDFSSEFNGIFIEMFNPVKVFDLFYSDGVSLGLTRLFFSNFTRNVVTDSTDLKRSN